LKNEIAQLFWDIFFYINDSVIMGRREYSLALVFFPL